MSSSGYSAQCALAARPGRGQVGHGDAVQQSVVGQLARHLAGAAARQQDVRDDVPPRPPAAARTSYT